MARLVTIGIPVYKRLELLPNALRCVAAQDYPDIELIVSDNGMNGDRVGAIVEAHYPKSFRLRRNPQSVSSARHFNQIIEAASGEYFAILADDDEISGNFVSELTALLDADPEAGIALSAQQLIDQNGEPFRHSMGPLPASLPGVEFVREAWRTHAYEFQCFLTYLSRTQDLRRIGGFPEFTGATHDDDAVLLKLCLGRRVVFSDRCTFGWRVYDESLGFSISTDELAAASREFLADIETDATLREFARTHPAEWRQARADVVDMVFDTYFVRWDGHYRQRMPRWEWARAAFAMPFDRRYYCRIANALAGVALTFVLGRVKRSVGSLGASP